MAFENATHINELNPASPAGSDDPFGTNGIDEELTQLKTVLTTDLGQISGAVTADQTDLNRTDITTEGTAEASKVLTVSSGSAINCSGITWSNLGAVTTADINGGAIDGVAIGATTPAAGSFTTLTASGSVTIVGGSVDGAAIGGTTPAAGAFTTLSSSGAMTVGTTLGVTGATTLSGTLGVSGAATFSTAKATTQLGFDTGAGGSVTQATSRTTAVTLNKSCGSITLVSAAGSTTHQTFTVNNSIVAAEDVVHVCQRSGTDRYRIHVTKVAAGSFNVSFATITGTTTEQPVFNFVVIKAVTA